MTREQYESFSVTALRGFAKEQGLRHISALKKSALIDALMAHETSVQQEKAAAEQDKTTAEPAGALTEKTFVREAENQETGKSEESAPESGRTGDRRPYRQNQNYQPDSERRQNRQVQYGQAADRRQSRVGTGASSGDVRSARQEQSSKQNTSSPQSQAARQTAAPQPQGTRQNTPQPQDRRTVRPARTENQSDADRTDRPPVDLAALDSGETAEGILEIMPDGYGFLRSNHYLSGENDIYVAPSQIRRFGLRTGDLVSGNTRIQSAAEKYRALLYLKTINGMKPSDGMRRPSFDQLTPIFPDKRIRLERGEKETAMRIVDLISPVGRGQRGMIVSPPKAGKTTLLKDIAKSILRNEPDMHIMIMLIDERPEEVTDIKEAIIGDNVEVLYSTFDELPEHHMRVAEMGIERARRLVEYGQHVTILLDSITRLARAYNLTVQPSGRTLSGGLDPAALHMPKRFFGAARNIREGGSLTILATALIDTGSKMDDVVYEEFKGTGNMELVLDRKLSERRVFPAIDIQKSGTRREDLLLDPKERDAVFIMRRALNSMKGDEAVESILNTFVHTANNEEVVARIRRQRTV